MSSASQRFVRLALLVLGIAVLLFVSQGLLDTRPEESLETITAIDLGETQPLHKLGDIYLGGQPAAEDFSALSGLGVDTVINLRKSSETDWDEAEVAGQQGMKYVHLPFQNQEELTDELFDQALLHLKDAQRGTTLLHCGSCNRVGAIWYAYRVLEEDVAPEQAEQEARTAGMRSDWLLDAAKDYVERRRSGE